MAKLLKDLYDENYINILSNNIINIYTAFDKNNFITSIFNNKWQDKELKQRMRHISNTLYAFLPNNYDRIYFNIKKYISKNEYSIFIRKYDFSRFC